MRTASLVPVGSPVKIGGGSIVSPGAIVLDGATVGMGSILGVGAVVPPRTVILPIVLALCFPVKPIREGRDGKRGVSKERQWLTSKVEKQKAFAG